MVRNFVVGLFDCTGAMDRWVTLEITEKIWIWVYSDRIVKEAAMGRLKK